MQIDGEGIVIQSVDEFEMLLRNLTDFSVDLSETIRGQIQKLIQEVGKNHAKSLDGVESAFYGRLNQKLGSNRAVVAALYSAAAKAGITFNYHQKKEIAKATNEADVAALRNLLFSYDVGPALCDQILADFRPVTRGETKALLRKEASNPSKLRKSLEREVIRDVHESCAGPLVWSLWSEPSLFNAFGAVGESVSANDYLTYLKEKSPELFTRQRALTIRFVDGEISVAREARRADINSWVSDEYARLANHGFLALVVSVSVENPGDAWSWINDTTICAERFKQTRMKQMFFRSGQVATETSAGIPSIDLEAAQFDILNEGFTYRDVFVLTKTSGQVQRLLLLLQKNHRDETQLPCPTCRSSNVEGNSYPTLGVKSWECRNLLCPDRSIYNRGKRFQFKSVVNQAAIENPRDAIEVVSVRRWQRDVLPFKDDSELIDTLLSHYSMTGDGVAIIDAPHGARASDERGRIVRMERYSAGVAVSSFWESSFFRRYVIEPAYLSSAPTTPLDEISRGARFSAVEGDSTEVLRSIPDNTFDRAITSPPYFNAREYSQWTNLYTYLHDMYANAREVYRTLKPGAIYAYNIFDYFDNEKVVAFSDMGKKRIPLAALMSDVFSRVGFDLAGTIPWDKGEIHGKRGYNSGNFSPFYQSPFNCWEHVLILRKPAVRGEAAAGLPARVLNSVVKIHPVVKMVRGKNQYGHSAPFPEALPRTLMAGLAPNSLVLDPYGGSGTTARAGLEVGVRTLLIEMDAVYAQLARDMTARKLQNAMPLPMEQSYHAEEIAS